MPSVVQKPQPKKFGNLSKIQHEVGVNLPLLHALHEAHQVAKHLQQTPDTPSVILKAASEASQAVDTLMSLLRRNQRDMEAPERALLGKLKKASQHLEHAKQSDPSVLDTNTRREREAFLDDLTHILQRAGQGQQEYVMSRAKILAEFEQKFGK